MEYPQPYRRTPGVRVLRPLAACLVGLALASCGSGSGDESIFDASFTDEDGICGIPAQRAWVDTNMHDYYLFHDQVPTVRLEDYATADDLVKAQRVPPDRFSYVGDAALNDAFFEEGEDFGYGWRLRRRDDGDLVIALVEPQSPVATAGVVRGEVLRSIDGTDANSIATNEQANALLGTGSDERTITLGIEGLDGTERQVQVTRGLYSIEAVLDVRILEVGTTRVGYLSFLTFIETARDELADAFAELVDADIDELVIDLRFNGGGRIDVANVLASRVIGAGGEGHDFLRYRFNDRYQDTYDPDDLRQPFQQLSDSLDLSRVYLLTQAGTCSASELVINGLTPLIDVITVGQTTCGKPFGTLGRTLHPQCNVVMQAVEVEFVNDAGVGDYADGIAATCPAEDTYMQPLGNPDESMLGVALQHISTGSCDTGIAATATTRGAFMSNASMNPTNPQDTGFPLP